MRMPMHMPWQEVMEQLDPSLEQLDPSLEPIMSKAVVKVGAHPSPLPEASPKPNPSSIPHPDAALARALAPAPPQP